MTGTELQQMLDSYCQEMKATMPGFLYIGILSCTDGTTLANASNNGDVAKFIEQESSSHLMIINQVTKVLATDESAGKLGLEFILIETDKITFMFSMADEGKFFALTALDREKSNLAISKMLLQKGKEKLGTMLEQFFS